MTSRTPDELAGDPDAFLGRRFGEILRTGKASDGDEADGRPPTRRDAATGVFYRPDEILTLREYVDAVAGVIRAAGLNAIEVDYPFDRGRYDGTEQTGNTGKGATGEPASDDAEGFARYRETLRQVARLRIAGPLDRERDALEMSRMVARAAADSNRDDVPDEIVVGPHHVLTIAPTPSIGPGSDPLPAKASQAINCGEAAPSETIVGVVDTGLWKDALQWPFIADPSEMEDPDPQPGRVVPSYGSGHGGFIAWLIHCTAPGLQVSVQNAFADGGLTELAVVNAADELIARGVRVLNLSLGTKVDTCSQTVPTALTTAVAAWHEIPDLVAVAAAGNDASSTPWYPAAFSNEPEYRDVVASVGALEPAKGDRVSPARARVAGFSNYGDWVKVWAPGVGLVSAYPKDVEFAYAGGTPPTQQFSEGYAFWDGTSFATPIVAARIAALAGASGNPREVWRKLRSGRPFVVVWPEWMEDEGSPCN